MSTSPRRATQLDAANPLEDQAGAKRSGSKLASATPKLVCIRPGTIEHWRPTEQLPPPCASQVSLCSAEVSLITDGAAPTPTVRPTPLFKAPAPLCAYSGPLRYVPDPTHKEPVFTCAQSSLFCGDCPVPHDQPLISDCFRVTNTTTADIPHASKDELLFIWHQRMVQRPQGWTCAHTSRLIRLRAHELGIGIWA